MCSSGDDPLVQFGNSLRSSSTEGVKGNALEELQETPLFESVARQLRLQRAAQAAVAGVAGNSLEDCLAE